MPQGFVLGASLTALATLGLIVAHAWKRRWGQWLTKPLASTGFLIAAHAAGALREPWGQGLFAGLALSWVGDVLLIPRHPKAFLAGLVSFLLGHVAFTLAFLWRGLDWSVVGVSALPLLLVALVVWRVLRPHVPRELRGPVLAYITVIASMVAFAFGTHAAHGSVVLLGGAIAFFLSDLSVARERFVDDGWKNKAWGLPLYYGAQLALAASVMGSAS